MEALEEQNKKLMVELASMKEQMAQMMELMCQNNNAMHHSDHGSHHEEEEEEEPLRVVPLGRGVTIREPEVSKEQINALEDRLRAMQGNSFDVKDAADMCLVKDIQFPPKFKVPDFLYKDLFFF